MATKVKEDALVKEKSFSAPSTPRRGDIRHSKRPTIESLVRDPSMLQEKPIPNYLKPTISSCHHNNCHYPKKKSNSQPSEVSSTAGKSLPPRKPIDDRFPLLLSTASRVPPKTSCGDQAKFSSDTGFENSPMRTLMRARSLPKFTTKKRDINVDNSAKKSNGSRQQDHTPKQDVDEPSKQKLPEIRSPPRWKDNKNSSRHSFGEEHKNEHSESPRNAKTHRAKAAAPNNGDGGKLKSTAEGDRKSEQERASIVKRQDVGGKETLPPMYNEVIEETASKLAARRSKVKALVGAFETVISLQEPEGQLGQPYGDDETKARRGEETEKTSKDSRLQPAETKNIEKDVKNDKIDQKSRQEREKGPKKGQLDQHKPQEEEETKGCKTGQDIQQEEPKESEVNPDGQLIEQHEVNAAKLGQESQQVKATSKDGQTSQNSQLEEAKETNERKERTSYEAEKEETERVKECDEPTKNKTE